MDLLFGNWAMLDASGHDWKLAFLQPDIAVPELHPESPLDHQEQLVFVVMLMPNKLALEFHQLDVLPVQLANDPGAPVIVEEGELLTQVHLGDRSVSEDASDELPLAN